MDDANKLAKLPIWAMAYSETEENPAELEEEERLKAT